MWAIIDEFLHSDLASRQDNYRKRKVILTLPADLETGEEQYCVHWQRELRSNWKSLFVLLSGLDARGNPVARGPRANIVVEADSAANKNSYKAQRHHWILPDTTENTACNKCGGECQYRNGTWAKMSGGLIPFLTEMLCPPVVIPNVVRLGNIEPTTGLEIPGDTTAVFMIRTKC